MSQWTQSEDERTIVRVLVRGLVNVAREDIDAAEVSVRRSRLEDSPNDSGSIRRLRVALRRIEYQLATMSEVDPTLDTELLVDRLHEVAKPFGQLRDTEIIKGRVVRALGDRGSTTEGERLLGMIAEEHDRAQRASDASLDSVALRDTEEALNEFRATLPGSAVTPSMARPVAQQAVRVTWRSVKRAAKIAKEHGEDELLHTLRRTVKRAVYATRGFSYVLGPSAEEFASRLVLLQKALGRQHDHVIVAAWLEQKGEDHASLRPLAHSVSLEERRRADRDAEEWTGLWAAVRALHPKETVMTTYSFFD